MPSNLDHAARIVTVPDKKLAGLAMICVVSFFSLLPYASAQSKSNPYHTNHSTHFKTGTHVHSVDQKPRSVTSSVAPGAIGKPSGRAGVSPNKELDQLERANLKPATAKRAPLPAATKSTITPEKHSAPINFTHKELPQTTHSRPAKTH